MRDVNVSRLGGTWPDLVDAALACLLAAVIIAVAALRSAHQGTPIGGGQVVFLAVVSLTLSLRRRYPLAVFVTTCVLTALDLASGHAAGPLLLAPAAAMLTMIALLPRRTWIPLVLASAAVITICRDFGVGWSPMGTVIFPGAWLLLAAVFGAGWHVRERFLAEMRSRAAWAERSRNEEARRLLAEERLRISQEMHDGIGHSLAVISLQAGVAEHLLDARPHEARKALAAILDVSRKALSDLRGELALLRGDLSQKPAPVPGPLPEAVQALVAGLRDAGLPVDVSLALSENEIPDIVARAAYRIVQESLTNIVRHAGPGAHAAIRLTESGSALHIEISDDGVGTAVRAKEGTGLTGMRERATALGGTFTAQREAGRGFSVRATLPLPRRNGP